MTAVQLPWVFLRDRGPEDAQEALWLDIEGSLHLGRLRNGMVVPATYNNGQEAFHRLEQHVAWLALSALLGSWVMIQNGAPESNTELLWQDKNGVCHLGVLKNGMVEPAVYANNDTVRLPYSNFVAWQAIAVPQGELAEQPVAMPDKGMDKAEHVDSWVSSEDEHIRRFESKCEAQGLSVAKKNKGRCRYRDPVVAKLWAFYVAGAECENGRWQFDVG